MVKDTTGFIMSWVYGILIVLLIVFIVNIFSYFVSNAFTSGLVGFINSNIIYIIIISFFFFLGSFCYYLGFPANLGFPIFDGIGGALLVNFLINFIVLIDKYAFTGIGAVLQPYSYLFSVIIFFIIVIFGYISVLRNPYRRDRRRLDRRELDQDRDEDLEEDDDEIVEEVDESYRRPIRSGRRRVVRRRIVRR